MISEARPTRNTNEPAARRWLACVCAAALLALVGCKSTKEAPGGAGVSRPKDKSDPLVHGPTKIPRQDLPIPDRATGGKGKVDPLTTPTGGGKAGYTDDPERFKGTYIPGKPSTPAALAARSKDEDELRIASPGVPLTLAGGTGPGGMLEAPEGVAQLYAQLDRYGVKPEDRSLERKDGKYVFFAMMPPTGNGTRRQYEGAAATAPEAVKQVLDQVAADRK